MRALNIGNVVREMELSIKGEDQGPAKWERRALLGRIKYAYWMEIIYPYLQLIKTDPVLPIDARNQLARLFMKRAPDGLHMGLMLTLQKARQDIMTARGLGWLVRAIPTAT